MRVHEMIERLQELERLHGDVAVAMPDQLDVFSVNTGNETENVEVVYISDMNDDGKTRRWYETPEYCAASGLRDPLALKAEDIAPPNGMTGLAVDAFLGEKWKIYAVAADWTQPSSPVMVFGNNGWTNHQQCLKVADVGNNARNALDFVVREAIIASEPHQDNESKFRIKTSRAPGRDSIDHKVKCMLHDAENIGPTEDWPDWPPRSRRRVKSAP